MKTKAIFIIALVGMLFSGFLTVQKLFSGTCSLKEGCAYLFGLPTCLYGLIMFAAIALISFLVIIKKTRPAPAKTATLALAAIGILFSGYYSITELTSCNGCSYSLLLPACVYGLVMYLTVGIIIVLNKD
jgi:uncharacterized membrane protein